MIFTDFVSIPDNVKVKYIQITIRFISKRAYKIGNFESLRSQYSKFPDSVGVNFELRKLTVET